MELLIRKAVVTDAVDMANIHIRSWEAAYTGIVPDDAIAQKNAGRPEMWQKTLSGEHNNYIALSGDMAVGFIGIHPSRDEDLPSTGEIGGIYLHPGYWGKGFGRQMMDFAVETLTKRGFTTITLWVLKENARARRFYEKYGFKFDGTNKELNIGKPLVGMRYRLDF